MRRPLPIALLAAVALTAALTAALNTMAKDNDQKLLRHVVMFKFKDSVTAEQVKEVEQAFAALPGQIDTIVDFEWGTDVSVEGKAKGFTHCFFVSFRDEKGREVYLPHPAHKRFVKLVGPRLADVLVVDYFAR